MLKNNRQLFSYIMASIALFFWASAFPGIKYCLAWYAPGSIMLLRFIVAAVTLFLLSFRQKMRRPERGDLPLFIAGGFIGIFGYMWLLNVGSTMMQSGVSSFIIASAPIFALLFSVVFLREKPTIYAWLGIFISAGGLVMIAGSQTGGITINGGILPLLGAAVCTALYNIIQKKILYKYHPMEATLYVLLVGAVFALIFSADLLRDFTTAPLAATLVVIYMGVFPAGLAYLFWVYALHAAENTASVVMFLYLTPFVAMVMAFVWLDERMPLLSFAGGVVIVAGMVVNHKFGGRR